jgi:peroxiredoxin
MNQLKAVFVVIYMMTNAVLMGWSLWMLGRTGFSLAWIGALVATGAVTTFFGLLLAVDMPRTRPALMPLLLTTLAGTALVLADAAWQPQGDWRLPLAAAAGAGLLGTAAYVFWYSKLGRGINAQIAVGRQLPRFDAEDGRGDGIDSSAFLGRPTLIMFYRGNWCPLCMAQVKEIAAQYRELARRGVDVVLVSPQPHTHTTALAARHGVPFRFLVDHGGRAAKKLGLLHTAGLPMGLQALGYASDTVYPTVIITDKSGTIIYCDQTDNYRVRPEPETFLRVLDAQLADAA